MKAYADTSFLVSLYTPDVNSAVAARAMRLAQTAFLLTPFGEVELTNAFELRLFRKDLKPAEVQAARTAFREDLVNGVYLLKPVPPSAYERAVQLACQYTATLGTRTLDVLHVAAALVLGANRFYTFDARQAELARQVGLD